MSRSVTQPRRLSKAEFHLKCLQHMEEKGMVTLHNRQSWKLPRVRDWWPRAPTESEEPKMVAERAKLVGDHRTDSFNEAGAKLADHVLGHFSGNFLDRAAGPQDAKPTPGVTEPIQFDEQERHSYVVTADRALSPEGRTAWDAFGRNSDVWWIRVEGTGTGRE